MCAAGRGPRLYGRARRTMYSIADRDEGALAKPSRPQEMWSIRVGPPRTAKRLIRPKRAAQAPLPLPPGVSATYLYSQFGPVAPSLHPAGVGVADGSREALQRWTPNKNSDKRTIDIIPPTAGFGIPGILGRPALIRLSDLRKCEHPCARA